MNSAATGWMMPSTVAVSTIGVSVAAATTAPPTSSVPHAISRAMRIMSYLFRSLVSDRRTVASRVVLAEQLVRDSATGRSMRSSRRLASADDGSSASARCTCSRALAGP